MGRKGRDGQEGHIINIATDAIRLYLSSPQRNQEVVLVKTGKLLD